MKKIVLLLIPFLAAIALHAQQKGQVFEKKADGSYTYYYSDAGKVSTLTFWDTSHKNGYAVAYNVEGKEVYRSETSWMHGSQTVKFKYHPNGVVREAHYHWQPDGGIQSGGMYTYFDQKGNKTGEQEERDPFDLPGGKNPNMPHPPKPAPKNPPQPAKPAPSPKEEEKDLPGITGKTFQTNVFLVNQSKWPVKVRIKAKPNKLPGNFLKNPMPIQPGDTLRMGDYRDIGNYEHPAARFDFVMETRKRKWKNKVALRPEAGTFRELEPGERAYFLMIERRMK